MELPYCKIVDTLSAESVYMPCDASIYIHVQMMLSPQRYEREREREREKRE